MGTFKLLSNLFILYVKVCTVVPFVIIFNNITWVVCFINIELWASLVAQWLRICLLMQGTRVRALVGEDPTCHGASRPMSHNY